ncbi:leucine Rich Repeat family protein [Colletotrichum graminicola]|uniref:Leucine Rich Repeat family protein n=1 Tax=Colletotrichum graminicola (strain M1.001 / M2 / FGSC 10212) TaxID=645133 RepID=E3QVT6_COLGM|nr:leucine Rich Repeat family protein [Colletotrichum graminicola M1.001]EFQ34974.1 leucine Rich Repeat family protein [Colletotrichum graminicola M1.001]WDK18190.1 leucine Rich Repeat family protein [Colletotrichum graminicola]
MADEPTLPSLSPSISWDAQTERFSNNPRKRRYNFKSHSVAPPSWSNSSDPAVFSSDDDPGLDNYVEGRRKKKKYVGSWFHQQPASSDSATGEPRPALRGKRTLKRDLDSGVWMGSDSTDGEESIMMPDLPTQSRLPQLNLAPPRRRNVVSAQELEARERIQQCLDSGNEYIDLSMMELKTLSDATIRPLSEFSCIPIVAEGVPFEQKDPALQLYLYRNPLIKLPGAIFDLEHLTVLSLRGCRLRELPPAIGKMRRLRTLNLAQNLLRYLPAELLDLMAAPSALEELLLQGNHFFQATERPRLGGLENLEGNGSEGLELVGAWKPGTDGVAARFFARSPVHYLDSLGLSHSDFRLDPEAVIVRTERQDGKRSTSSGSPTSSAPYHSKSAGRCVASVKGSRVPSLVELALRSAYKSSDLDELPHYIPDSLSHLQTLLERAADQREAGGLTCAMCKKPFVAPTTQWLEWWQVCLVESRQNEEGYAVKARPWTDLDEENDGAVPFLRRGCSWKCGPAHVREGQWTIRATPKSLQEQE